jgi:uncharacterized protein YcfL
LQLAIHLSRDLKMLRKLCLLSLAALLTGCSASQPSLLVQRAESDQSYNATFDRAYFAQAADGQVDVVLLSDGQGPSPEVDRPLKTSGDQTVRQVVHLRVLWSNPRGIRLDNPSASNAMVDWHIIASPRDRLTYTGSAWAKVSVDGDEATMDIRNATVVIRNVIGNCDDPLKRANLSGEVIAKRADATVRSYLDELAQFDRTDASTAQATPTRSPSAP